ncbi:hypothetical protein [Arthrobacter sp. Soil763]|uniref:hypothetical protein n=1 Tax=Arthrobacter sp. Soil763 TaxID=1736402 RepID=UPI0006FF3B0E|nr:hypothetical protein [Arthrobacter sp. Soil763]KRE79970.1 hypothetical protein ASG71_08010 [Arthrobacter sp. Soil763]
MTDQMTKIKIHLPLPMDVAGTLMRIIGASYPEALMEGNSGTMTFLIPEKARPRKVSAKAAKPDEAMELQSDLLEIGPDGISISTPEHLAAACLQVIETSFQQFPDAKNYLEQRCYNRETREGYVMTFQRMKGKSPAELREAAESKLQRVEAAIKLLYPDDMTPMAKSVLEKILQEAA